MRFLVVLVLLVGTACGSPATPTSPDVSATPTPPTSPTPASPTPATLAGVWTLVTVDGATLPVVLVRFGSDRVELVSVDLTLAADGTATEVAQSRLTTGGSTETDTTTEAGTFTLDGTTIELVGDNGTRRTGTLSGTPPDTLTALVEGATWVFRKR